MMEKLPKNQPITTIARHAVKPGLEKEFEQWAQNIGQKVKSFEGFQGIYLTPPKKGTTQNEYSVAFQFKDIETLTLWMDSNERKEEIQKLHKYSSKEMELEQIEGIDFWFTPPDTKKGPVAPPKWKMAFLTWLGVFPGVVLLSMVYKNILGGINPILITMFVTMTLVPLLTWVIMPNLVKLFKKWLF